MENFADNILSQVLNLKASIGSQIPFSFWTVLLSIFVLHVLRQVYFYYTFLTSEAMSMLTEHISFTKTILPSFLVSIICGVRTINITYLSPNIAANAGLKKLHHHPGRSTYHTFYTDVHGYKSNFVIATDTSDKVMAFRQVMTKFISDRITSGLLQKTVAEGVLKWVDKESFDIYDVTLFLERVVMRFLYDIDPEEIFTPEQRQARARIFFDGTKWVLYDSYRPMGSLCAVLWQNTGIDFDPVRRPVIKALTEIWDDVYDRQMEMVKKGKNCLLGQFLKDPIIANMDLDFIKANTVGAIMGGQFLTSISNITGMLYNVSNGDRPSKANKTNWLLQVVSDWSPLISILRTYAGFTMSIPSTGNAHELHRSFSLGQRQCPGKGMVLRAYGTLISLLSKYKITVEGIENTTIRSSLWPFANPNMKFRIQKQQDQQLKRKNTTKFSKLRSMGTMNFNGQKAQLRSMGTMNPNGEQNKLRSLGTMDFSANQKAFRKARTHTLMM